MNVPSFDNALAAHLRIAPHIHRTPVLTSEYLSGIAGAELHFKCENFQKTGAFKARGAVNAVLGLSDSAATRGVVTHSSGNHGASLAYAAGLRQIAATVVMPRDAVQAKKDAVQHYGGHIVECEPTASARERAVAELLAASGGELVHPYNDAWVIAGQATCALELLEQVAGLDAIIAPVGGGGLVSGTCLAVRGRAPGVEVFAAEPELADDAHRSHKAGELINIESPQTIADGLRAPLKHMTWHFVARYVKGVVTVGEFEIVDAMKLMWQRMKITAEPSSAVALAAVLRCKETFAGKRVGNRGFWRKFRSGRLAMGKTLTAFPSLRRARDFRPVCRLHESR